MINKKTFKILSIDGGGIRGIYSAYILKRVEEEFKIKLHDYFDLIAGTSTGSIIAAAIACNISIDDIVNNTINISLNVILFFILCTILF